MPDLDWGDALSDIRSEAVAMKTLAYRYSPNEVYTLLGLSTVMDTLAEISDHALKLYQLYDGVRLRSGVAPAPQSLTDSEVQARFDFVREDGEKRAVGSQAPAVAAKDPDRAVMTHLSIADARLLVAGLANRLIDYSAVQSPPREVWLYGVPRGGVPVALMLHAALEAEGYEVRLLEADPLEHNPITGDANDLRGIIVVDDLVDSGKTAERYLRHGATFAALYAPNGWDSRINCVQAAIKPSNWVVFPWEANTPDAEGPADAVRRILQFLGRDPDSPDLIETPRRVLSWLEGFRGDIEPKITTFDGFECDEMVMVKRIPFVSLCEHHLLPFAGEASVAYIPGMRLEDGHYVAGTSRVIGLSKLARIVQAKAAALQVQERLTTQIRDAIEQATGSHHVAVRVEAEHMCMSLRGPRVPSARTVTTALSGSFKENDATRAEFLDSART